MSDVYILSGARTPFGSFRGGLSTVAAPQLGAKAIEGALSKSQVEKEDIQSVLMGNVIQAGVGQAPARQASLFAGLSQNTPCVTINKVCGSGMETIISGSRLIQLKEADCVVAGGMENMSLAPHFIPASRQGMGYGDQALKDAMQNDGLWDVYSERPMGNCAEECVSKYSFTREEQDQYAISSFKRAQAASEKGFFQKEIVSVSVKQRKSEVTVDADEGPFKAKFEKIPSLRPAFDKQGTITAANASTINDGAAALVIGGEKFRERAQFRIVAHSGHAHGPTFFTTAPIQAMQKCLNQTQMSWSDIDFFEINEAFAVVPMAAMKELELPHEKVNVNGGAISIGHPLGASGTRIVLSLMNTLNTEQKKYGMAGICLGGGEALALIIERL